LQRGLSAIAEHLVWFLGACSV